jgi:hypothetical protein
MIQRSKQNKNCQKDFSSPVSEKIQANLLEVFNKPSSAERWDYAVYYSGMLMNYYLEDCPAGRSWLSAGSTGKLKNIVQKRNNNIKRD